MLQEMLIEVWPTDRNSSAKASAQVTLLTDYGELTLSRLKVIHQDGKGPWVAYPTIDFKSRETGEFRHLSVITPGVRLKRAIQAAVLVKYAELGVESR